MAGVIHSKNHQPEKAETKLEPKKVEPPKAETAKNETASSKKKDK